MAGVQPVRAAKPKVITSQLPASKSKATSYTEMYKPNFSKTTQQRAGYSSVNRNAPENGVDEEDARKEAIRRRLKKMRKAK